MEQGKLTFELSDDPQKHCSYGDLILNRKVFARDIHRDHAIDTMHRWNSHDALLAACKAFVKAWEKSLQLEKTDIALRLAKAAIAAAQIESDAK